MESYVLITDVVLAKKLIILKDFGFCTSRGFDDPQLYRDVSGDMFRVTPYPRAVNASSFILQNGLLDSGQQLVLVLLVLTS